MCGPYANELSCSWLPFTPSLASSFPSFPLSSLATEMIKGRAIDDCLKIKNSDIAGHLKLPPVKLHCRCAMPCLHPSVVTASQSQLTHAPRCVHLLPFTSHSMLAEDAIKAAVKDYQSKNSATLTE